MAILFFFFRMSSTPEEVASPMTPAENVEENLNQRQGFSSENFKIEIQNLPKFWGIGQMKKLLVKKMNINPHKIKPCGPGAKYMFMNFANEEDREAAIAKLNGFELKGRKLKAFKMRPAKDPMLKMKEKEDEAEVDDRPPRERILSVVCPLFEKTYQEQMEAKKGTIEEVLKTLRQNFMKQNGFFKSHGIEESQLAVLEDIIPSPQIKGYRNKCEFTIGRHPESNEPVVGFRLASYRKGSVAVVEIDHLPIVSDEMKSVVKHFEQFVRTSKFEPFDNVSQKGNWKQLTVRQGFGTGDLLVWTILHPQGITQDDQDQLKADLKAHFETFEPKVTSLNIQFFGQRMKGQGQGNDLPPVMCLNGEGSIKEKLMDLEFKVSPQAFFQVNTQGAEKLYKACGDIANLDDQTILFDVCCGTGTIGLCLASKVKEVHGVDIIEESVKDANENAKKNGIMNAHFHAGRAEFILPELLRKHDKGKTVAIVDPPRAGLHPKAVFALRASNIDSLVYVSCDAKAAMNNFIDLGRMTSKAYKGDPFVPKKVIPVDLFPHTNHFELIIYFERFPLKKSLKCEETE